MPDRVCHVVLRAGIPASVTAFLLLGGWRVTPSETPVTPDPSREWLLVETVTSRHLSCNEPERAREVLLRFLGSLGAAATVDAERGEASIRGPAYNEAVLHWKVEANELQVVAQEPREFRGFAATLITGLAVHLRVAGLYDQPGPFSGLLVPPEEIDGGIYLGAVLGILSNHGSRAYEVEVGCLCNDFTFPFSDGAPEWRVHAEYYAGPTVEVDVTNVSSPFDGASEESLLRDAMKGLTPRPISYGQCHIRTSYIILSTPR